MAGVGGVAGVGEDLIKLYKHHFALGNEVTMLIQIFFLIPKVITSGVVTYLLKNEADSCLSPSRSAHFAQLRNSQFVILLISAAIGLWYGYKYTRHQILHFFRAARWCFCHSPACPCVDCLCLVADQPERLRSKANAARVSVTFLSILAYVNIIDGSIIAIIDILGFIEIPDRCPDYVKQAAAFDLASSVVIFLAALWMAVRWTIGILSSFGETDQGYFCRRGKTCWWCLTMSLAIPIQAVLCCSICAQKEENQFLDCCLKCWDAFGGCLNQEPVLPELRNLQRDETWLVASV